LESISQDDEQSKSLSKVCVEIHESVELASVQMRNEMSRYYYTTPSSYLELIKQYELLLNKRIESITSQKDRISNGLFKLLDTNEKIKIMGEDLNKIVPKIEEATVNMRELVATLERDSAQADVVKRAVLNEEIEAKVTQNIS
jgi:dynein heavy chain